MTTGQTRSIPYWHVDAFTSQPFAGNQAAVMLLEEWLPDETLRAIAAEHNFAETAFVVATPQGEAPFALRWFTPLCEVRLCGHATLAAGHVLLTRGGEGQAGRTPPLRWAGDDAGRVTFATRYSGILEVRRLAHKQIKGNGYEMALPATTVVPGENAALLAALGVAGGTAGEVFMAAADDAQTAIVLLLDEAAVRALQPDFSALRAINLMAICTAPADAGSGADIVSRVFAPAWGVEEDSVTGSAHAALLPFWAARLERSQLTAYQASARGGRLTCRFDDRSDAHLDKNSDGARVWLGGACTCVVEGVFHLPASGGTTGRIAPAA